MALIRCYDCGKEISSLATACPSCGAPPRPTTVPPPLPTQSSRAKQLSWGTIALLTGVVLVLVIRGVTHQANSLSVTTSPTPATGEATTTSSPPVETASQSSPSLAATETPSGSDASVTTAPPPRATYQVVGIPLSDYLNVREGAGSDYPVVTQLEPGTSGIQLGSKRIANGGTTWQEITVHGQTGWVNAAYIALETQAPPSPTESSTAP
jgi:uncharacterized protein YgiM (DUF1202 family)